MFVSYIKGELGKILSSFKTLPGYVQWVVVAGIVLGTLPRLLHLFELGFRFDMVETQYTWGKAGFEMGVYGFWRDYQGFFDYLPFSLLLEMLLYTKSLLFGGSAQAFVTLMKMFNWLTEIVLVLIFIGISLQSLQNSKFWNTAQVSILSWSVGVLTYILPSIWFVSGVWGQNDSWIVLLGIVTLGLVALKQDENTTSSNKSVLLSIAHNNFFWSGIVFAVAFWTKQQIILIVPALILYHLYRKTWKNLVVAVTSLLPYGLIIAFGANRYVQGDWETAKWVAIILLVLGFAHTLISVYIGREGQVAWKNLQMQLLGFLLVTVPLWIPLALVNHVRSASTAFAVVGRSDNVTNGASTLWPLLGITGSGKDPLFQLGYSSLTVGSTAYLIFILLGATLAWYFYSPKKKDIFTFDITNIFWIKPNFTDLLVLTTIFSGAYFLFFTKMHSRYFHFTVLLSLPLLAILSTKEVKWRLLVAVLALQLGYFLNQLGVYAAWEQDPTWPGQLLSMWAFDAGKLSSLLNIFGFFGIFGSVLEYYRLQRNEKLEVS